VACLSNAKLLGIFFSPHNNVRISKYFYFYYQNGGKKNCQEDAGIVKVLPYWGRKTKEQ
jgi:hypothetical protein